MKKIFFVALFIAGSCPNLFAEQVTLTTYYPAPFGMYQEMRVAGKLGVATTAPAADLDVNGSIFFTGGSGNVNGDGGVNATDALLAALYAAGTAPLTREQQARADVDGNGSVTHEDANIILQMAVGFTRELAKQRVNKVAYKRYDQTLGGIFLIDSIVGINTTDTQTSKLTVDEAGAVNRTANAPLGIFQTGTKSKTALAAVSLDSAGTALTNVGNTALYAHGGDYAGYFSSGKIYSAGNVGIGTTNPATRLTVDDGTGVFSAAGSLPLALIMTGTTNVPGLAVISTNSAGVSMPNYENTAIYGYGTMYGGHFQGVYGGLLGEGDTVGLAGNSSSGDGVFGSGPQSGVVGSGPTGVNGQFTQSTGYGVYGHNSNGVTGGTGVYGYSWAGTGVYGKAGSAGAGSVGVKGEVENLNAGTYAGSFIGPVKVSNISALGSGGTITADSRISAGGDKPVISLGATTSSFASDTCQEVCTTANLTCMISFVYSAAGGHNRSAAWYDCTQTYAAVPGLQCLCY